MKGYRIPHHKLKYVMPSCHLHGRNSSRLISSSTSHQTHECIMSSSTRYVISINISRQGHLQVHHHQTRHLQAASSSTKGIIKSRSKLHHHQPNSISIIWAPPHQTVTTARATIKNATHNCCCHQYNHQAGWHQ